MGQHTRPSRRSKIAALPAELVQQVHQLIDAGHTYSEIAQHLTALDHPVSASSVQRYGQQFLARQRLVSETADKAAALMGAVGSLDLEEAAARLSLDAVVRKLIDITTIDDVDDLNRVMANIARMTTAGVARERWKTDVAKRARAAADDAGRIAKQGGLSESAVQLIRARILGLAEESKP